MTDIGHAERAAEVDIAIAVDVPDVGTLCALPEDRRHRGERGDVAALDGAQPLRE